MLCCPITRQNSGFWAASGCDSFYVTSAKLPRPAHNTRPPCSGWLTTVTAPSVTNPTERLDRLLTVRKDAGSFTKKQVLLCCAGLSIIHLNASGSGSSAPKSGRSRQLRVKTRCEEKKLNAGDGEATRPAGTLLICLVFPDRGR